MYYRKMFVIKCLERRKELKALAVAHQEIDNYLLQVELLIAKINRVIPTHRVIKSILSQSLFHLIQLIVLIIRPLFNLKCIIRSRIISLIRRIMGRFIIILMVVKLFRLGLLIPRTDLIYLIFEGI